MRTPGGGPVLALDTAGERCAACVFDAASGRVLALAEPVIGRGHAEQLFAILDGVLAEAGIAYNDLGRVGVAVGPGSFTGIRVGVAAARGLALALNIPAVGVTVLEALAAGRLEGAAEPVLAVQDAKRGELYAALFAANGAVLGAPCALSPADLPRFCSPVPANEPLQIVGTGAVPAGQVLAGRRFAVAPPAAASIALIARIAAGRVPGAPPVPLYLRGADARPQTAVLKTAPAPAITA